MDWATWLDQAANYFVDTWKLNPDFAKKVALFYAYLESYGHAPNITSGFRDPSHQDALRARWDSGDHSGLRVRPAENSLHSHENMGDPDSLAIDIAVADQAGADAIARALGIGVGNDFRTPDPGHYYEKAQV